MSTKTKSGNGRERQMSQQVHVWMTPEERRMAERLSKEWGLPMSTMLRQLLRMACKEEWKGLR